MIDGIVSKREYDMKCEILSRLYNSKRVRNVRCLEGGIENY
jgi:hypothetical protein